MTELKEKEFVGKILTLTGYYMPILSSVALLIFKSSTDPLQGISKLDMMMIVSINQRVTEKFMPTMI